MASSRRVMVATGGVLGLMVLVGVGVIFFVSLTRYWRAQAQLRERDLELRGLYAKDPFPSDDNLIGERKNLKDLEGELGRLLEAMSHGQMDPEEQSPERFISQFHETRRRLEGLAAANGVTLLPKDDFAFGFDRHMAGSPPAHPDVRRLTRQLLIVEALCNELYAARITALRGIGREEFEQSLDEANGGLVKPVPRSAPRRGAQAATTVNVRNPDAGVIPDKALYGTWRFTLEFTAKEMALIDVLNRLARCDTFAAVTRVEVQGDPHVLAVMVNQAGHAENADGRQSSTTTAATAVVESAGQRLLAGLDTLLTVRMNVDVYQFRKATAAAVAAKGQTAAGG